VSDDARDYLLRQLDTAWKLASYHLGGLTTDECLWRPAAVGPHVEHQPNGHWRGGWPARESYDLGPPSIAWLLWHIAFWWSMVLDRSFGDGMLSPDAVTIPGRADDVRQRIADLHDRWRREIVRLTDDDLRKSDRTRWPFADRPFGDVIAWVNIELTKNAAEIGYVRFLYGSSRG
jgi:hypothetical protein